MEVVQEVNLENIENIINDFIVNICIENEYDIKSIRPLNWLYILNSIYKSIIKPNINILLKVDNNKCNQYDINKLLYIYNVYKNICLKYNHDISLMHFCDFSGIERQTIYNISSTGSFDIHQKIMSDNEESLEQMLKDKSINPMKILPILNKKHGWSLPGVTKETSKKELVARENIQEIGENKQVLLPEID